jgi:uncharacterized protein YciI
MPQYLCILTPSRPTFVDDATDAEQRTVGAHFEHLSDALAAGSLILAGRTLDHPPTGIVVFAAESDEAARAFIDADPAVKGGVFAASVRPYRVALLSGRLHE